MPAAGSDDERNVICGRPGGKRATHRDGRAFVTTGMEDATLRAVLIASGILDGPSLASEPGTFRGHDGVRRYFGSFDEAMDGVYFEGQAFTAVGEKVLVDTKLHARGRTTGIETEQRAFLVWTLREGMVMGVETFVEQGQALEAAGSD
jgi:hypothetical protein